MSNVVPFPGMITQQEAIARHLSVLTQEQKDCLVTDMIVIYSCEGGEAYTVPIGTNTTYLVGLIETIKHCILSTQRENQF